MSMESHLGLEARLEFGLNVLTFLQRKHPGTIGHHSPMWSWTMIYLGIWEIDLTVAP